MNNLPKNVQSKKWLNEVSLMRPFLLFLLVSYHAFAPYVGTWGVPRNIDEDIWEYNIIGNLSRAFRLEGFVFISGYIFTFQILERNKFDSLWALTKNKFDRLIIPCIVFGFFYFLCFRSYESFGKMIYDIIGGIGHLWYLPCLFFCFIVQYWLLQKNFEIKHLILVLFALSFLYGSFKLPFHFDKPLYYMLFFAGGGVVYSFSDEIAAHTNKNSIIVSWTLFLFFFIISLISRYYYSGAVFPNIIWKIPVALFVRSIKIITAWSGIIALYQTTVLYCRHYSIHPIIMTIGSCGYGVYVFHQFVLMFLYYHTTFPIITGTYIMPWLATVITIVVSISITFMIRKTSLGKKYL